MIADFVLGMERCNLYLAPSTQIVDETCTADERYQDYMSGISAAKEELKDL